MKEIFINVDSYNNEGIKTIQGNNNAEIYKICISKSKVRLSLVGKTVKLGYVMAGTTNGDILEDLNISNAEQGEITFPITNKISKKDGVYTCQLAIYGADGFLEYTATFGLTVQANIFTKIAGEIENSKDLTYIERILEEAKIVSGDLKTNIPVAANLNSSLESNISNARNINTTLADTTEKSKVAATDAIEKKSQLESSIVEAKKFIDGLDGSQNIPGIRMELTELQNGLKSNQALAYSGSSISAENTLEGRTEGMKIKGRIIQNLFPPVLTKNYSFQGEGDIEGNALILPFGVDVNATAIRCIKGKALIKPNQTYTVIVNILSNNTNNNLGMSSYLSALVPEKNSFDNKLGISKMKCTSRNLDEIYNCDAFFCIWGNGGDRSTNIKFTAMLLEGDWTSKKVPEYFEGIKSFGEAEQEGEKYKISILSTGKNLAKLDLSNKNITPFEDGYRLDCLALYRGDEDIFDLKGKYKENTQYVLSYYGKILDNSNANNYRIRVYYTDNTYTDGVVTGNKYEKRIIKTLSSKTVYKIIGYYGAMNGDFIVKDVMLEEGTQATQYESYKCDKKDILIKEPLRSIGDISDVMYEDNGQVKVNRLIGEKTLNGSEVGWGQMNDSRLISTMQFYIDTSSYMTSNSNLICNKFKFLRDRIIIDGIEGISKIGGNNTSIWINIKKDKLTTQDITGFKEWLKDNPITIAYQLATPVTEVVANCVDIDLDTYQEKTYFNILNSMPGILDFKVPSNIGSVVQNMAKEVNNIWDVINNLLVPSIVKANGNLAMLKLNNNLN